MPKNQKTNTLNREDDLSPKERLQVKKEIAKEHIKTIKSEFRTQTTAAVIAAFGFVIALSWQTVIKEIADKLPRPAFLQNYPFIPEVYSALLITLVCVIGILIISRWGKKQ
jgi:hypothetical protein